MQAALIVMTIMGCDDAATACHYIATPEERWPSIALCESASEEQLRAYANRSNYPVLIAACQTPTETAATPPPPEIRAEQPETAATTEQAGLARRAIERARAMLPGADGVKALATGPVRFAADGYNWVVSVFRK